jgi:ABC-type sugar transport system permease subunit
MSENVASYYWRGHGSLWKVYWLYGVLGSNLLALILLLLMQRGAIGSVWFQLVLLLLAAYTVWIVVSVWRCAFNVEKPMYGHMARALTVAWAINALLVLGFLELQFLQAVS